MLRTFNHFTCIVLACLILGSLGGYVTGKHSGFSEASDRGRRLPSDAIDCKPGPWGELSYTPFDISAPDDMIPVRSIETGGTRWFLPGYTADSFVSFLQGTSLSPDQQQQFLSPGVFQLRPDGIVLTPPADLVFALPEDARGKLYQSLAQSPENDGQINYIAKDSVRERFGDKGISPDTITLFKRLCVERGDYLMFSGVPALLSRIPTYAEKLQFAKGLTQQRTMVLRLHITPSTDVAALDQYWDRGCWGTDLKSIFHSLSGVSDGTWMNIMMILPNLPAAEIYDYPDIIDNPLDGPPVNRDCAWTSLNFFLDQPNPNFGKMQYVQKELEENYRPLEGKPRYGDLVVVARPDGYMVHVAIYIADDIWFTKNGSTLVHPWMLSTATDVCKQFEFQLNPDQHLTVKYLRNIKL